MAGIFRPTTRLLMQPSKRMLSVSKDTGKSSLKQMLSQVPIEVYPLGIILSFMASYGIYHMGKALYYGGGRGEFRTHKRKARELGVWET